ncbi:hypothetical protein CPB86DRAFT_139360 [Serendipita vermifera]|nr:hypothetical protein CPB86DRAFT_139360 [Serendipita vermifera]
MGEQHVEKLIPRPKGEGGRTTTFRGNGRTRYGFQLKPASWLSEEGYDKVSETVRIYTWRFCEIDKNYTQNKKNIPAVVDAVSQWSSNAHIDAQDSKAKKIHACLQYYEDDWLTVELVKSILKATSAYYKLEDFPFDFPDEAFMRHDDKPRHKTSSSTSRTKIATEPEQRPNVLATPGATPESRSLPSRELNRENHELPSVSILDSSSRTSRHNIQTPHCPSSASSEIISHEASNADPSGCEARPKNHQTDTPRLGDHSVTCDMIQKIVDDRLHLHLKGTDKPMIRIANDAGDLDQQMNDAEEGSSLEGDSDNEIPERVAPNHVTTCGSQKIFAPSKLPVQRISRDSVLARRNKAEADDIISRPGIRKKKHSTLCMDDLNCQGLCVHHSRRSSPYKNRQEPAHSNLYKHRQRYQNL